MILSSRLQAILFDLDGTLRHNRPSYSQFFIEIAAGFGVPESSEGQVKSQRWLHYYWAQSDEMLSDRAEYEDQPEQFWAKHAHSWLEAYGCPADMAAGLAPAISQHMADEFKPQEWVAPDVQETLDCLQEAGYRMAVVSNRNQACGEELERLGLLGYLEFALTSGEVNSWKPDTKIFKHALQRLDLQPWDALYVGDNFYADVIGASRAGIRPVLYDPDRIFPEANCPVIAAIGDLCGFLDK